MSNEETISVITMSAFCDFMSRFSDNPIGGPSHVSLFAAIFNCCMREKLRSPISVFSKELMKQAKISAGGTYYKCLHDLEQFGFIKYVPSHNPAQGSLIYLMTK